MTKTIIKIDNSKKDCCLRCGMTKEPPYGRCSAHGTRYLRHLWRDSQKVNEEISLELSGATSYFSEQIKKARLKLGESQTQFASRFGVATNSISRYETGTYEAPYEILLWCLMETHQLQDDIPTSIQHANLAIEQLQKVIEEQAQELQAAEERGAERERWKLREILDDCTVADLGTVDYDAFAEKVIAYITQEES